ASTPAAEVWPIIVAAGLGTRAASSGLNVPKPLAHVSGLPVIKRLVRVVQHATQGVLPPIVIISPEIESQVRDALGGEPIKIVVQPAARGSGDAVLCAYELVRDFHGRVLVVWGTQPVIRGQTLRRSLILAEMFPDYKIVLTTALTRETNVPLLRD